MILNSLKVLFLIALSIIFSSCVSSTKYYWGEYENLIYTQYKEPEKAIPEIQIQKLQADIQKAASKDQPLPPGFYAHLGYQYLQVGKAGEARQYFNAEKKAFPESAALMDRFLKKIK
ncbi:MAG: hypothetical protein A2622_04730 [Bdellovibrionales bacterium RIFCSPHIGHO2_01_FULL_40_29]|nr:MAG: hypothetical protein A2622_04730 [Bdellovibrionales bacterium RIFCSPHIGHO2_01_FULL_40_29]OFZ34761.1 MAG: hypothetical protein A3D17_10640 [Bdellovibrionales bacterium RIFCSPHIGHO2_02_FULL_40_15]